MLYILFYVGKSVYAGAFSGGKVIFSYNLF